MFSSFCREDEDDFEVLERARERKKEIEFLDGIVVDFGNGFVKAGFGGEEAPRAMFPNCVGKLEDPKENVEGKYFVGDEVDDETGNEMIEIRRTLTRGIVTNWDEFEEVMHHCLFKELRIKPSEYSLTLSDSPLLPRTQREKMAEIVFEKFEVPAFYIGIKPALSIYSLGRTAGVVCQCGYGVTSFVPIYDGECIKKGFQRMNMAGQDVSSNLSLLFLEKEKGRAANSLPFFNKNRKYRNERIFDQMKESLCYVCYDDYEKEMESSKSHTDLMRMSYELPDSEMIVHLESERFQSPEILFQPSLFSDTEEKKGIHEYIFDSITKSSLLDDEEEEKKERFVVSDFDLHKDLFRNIIVSGGTSLLPGFSERIGRELEYLAKNKYQPKKQQRQKVNQMKKVIQNVKVISSPERKYASWIGGSILSGLSTFKTVWVTKKMFEESGPNIIHKKFL